HPPPFAGSFDEAHTAVGDGDGAVDDAPVARDVGVLAGEGPVDPERIARRGLPVEAFEEDRVLGGRTGATVGALEPFLGGGTAFVVVEWRGDCRGVPARLGAG